MLRALPKVVDNTKLPINRAGGLYMQVHFTHDVEIAFDGCRAQYGSVPHGVGHFIRVPGHPAHLVGAAGGAAGNCAALRGACRAPGVPGKRQG